MNFGWLTGYITPNVASTSRNTPGQADSATTLCQFLARANLASNAAGPRARQVKSQDEQGNGDRECDAGERAEAAGGQARVGRQVGGGAQGLCCLVALDLSGAGLVPGKATRSRRGRPVRETSWLPGLA